MFISNSTGVGSFVITEVKLYVPVITLSTQDNAKLLQQIKLGFKKTLTWNKYRSKISTERQNQYLDYLIDPSFQEVKRLFVLFFQNENNRTPHSEYDPPKVAIKEYKQD